MSGDVPTHIGRYTIERSLGFGGMGEVFLAYTPAGSPVAVKLIRTDKLDPHTRARFEREAQVARTVVGTNRVARFLDANPYADRPWLAMEYVPGQTLLDFVRKQGVLPAALVASLGALLAEGLEAVHASGLLHRDLKPQNIILGGEGPMIIDFGLSAFIDASHDSLSQSGTIVGTVRCMPPEQANGNRNVTAAADVYALGTVLLFAATGHYPFDGQTYQTIIAHIVNRGLQPDLDGTPEVLVPLLRQMLAFEATDRPSLADTAMACAKVLSAERMTPRQARIELIDRTAARGDGTRPENPAPSPPVKDLLGAVEPSDADIGALDVPPATPEELTPGAGEDGSEGEAPPPASGRRQGRPPASERIAEKLRADYAAQPSL
jgi:serine/threonine protein kinase